LKVPNPASVNLPDFFKSLTTASSRAFVARVADVPDISKDCRRIFEIKALDIQKPSSGPNAISQLEV
jgi:hypothetical protein